MLVSSICCTQHYTGNGHGGKVLAAAPFATVNLRIRIWAILIRKQGESSGQGSNERRQVEEGSGGPGGQLAGGDGGFSHLPDAGRPRYRSGARAGAAPLGWRRVG